MSTNAAQLLLTYFERKKKSRSGFSLRGFAKSMRMSPSFVSNILNGKKTIPLARLTEIGKILELDDVSLDRLKRALIEETFQEHGIDIEKTLQSSAVEKYELAPKSQFSVLTPWYNVAIMDLSTCVQFQKDPLWIAQQLQISKYQVEQSLKFLLSQGLLKETKNGYKKVTDKIRLSLNESHQEIRGYHAQMMEKAKAELLSKTSKKSFDRREISGITIASNPKNIAKARQRLIAALHDVGEILGQGECTDLFQINTQMFSLLKSED